MPMSSHPKTAQPDHDILEVIRDRWSPRAFDPSRPVRREDLLRLFEAARWAPSSGNEQPWRFVVIDRAGSPGAFEALLGSLTGRNPLWARTVPVFVVVAVRETLERDESVNRHAWYDAGQAVALLVLQATSMGIFARQMEGFDRDRARQACQMPAPFEPAVVMALGYPGDAASLEYDKHREAERTPRKRKKIEEFVFEGTWGKGY
jgi:nitroreductase